MKFEKHLFLSYAHVDDLPTPGEDHGWVTSAGTSWRIAQFRPGSRPINSMTGSLAADGVLYRGYNGAVPLDEILDTSLRVSKRGLLDVFRKARLPDGTNLLVIVDQFEELFRYQTRRSALVSLAR